LNSENEISKYGQLNKVYSRHSYYHPVAFIDQSELNSNDYLIRTGATTAGKDQATVDAGEIARTYYTVDLRSGMSVMTDCTLIGENDFFSNWPPVYTHVRFPNINQDFYLRSVTPGFKEERIQIHAVSYEPD
jgi:hypothetical protein